METRMRREKMEQETINQVLKFRERQELEAVSQSKRSGISISWKPQNCLKYFSGAVRMYTAEIRWNRYGKNWRMC